MIFLFANFAETALTQACGSGDLVLHVEPSAASEFPFPGPGEVFAAILQDGVRVPEIVYCTQNAGTGSLTVMRGQEASGATSWAEGSALIHTLTAGSISWFSTGGADVQIADLQEQIDALELELASLAAALAAESGTRESADLALSDSIEQSNFEISQVAQGLADVNLAFASLETTLTAAVASNTASIVDLYEVTANNTGAIATLETTLTASINGVNSAFLTFQSAQVTFNSATTTSLAELTADYGDSEGRISTLETLRLSDNSAVASQINTLSINYGDLAGDLVVTQMLLADIEGNISGKYGVAITAGGAFAGFEVMAGSGPAGPTVSVARFAVADFLLTTPAGDKTPFAFDTMAGVAFLQNIVVDGADIKDATIISAKIGDLEVETIKIANAAVTNQERAFTAGSIVLTTTYQVVQTVPITTEGGYVNIVASLLLNDAGTSSTRDVAQVSVFRDSTLISTQAVLQELSSVSPPLGLWGFIAQSAAIVFDDQPAAGSYTYTLQAKLGSAVLSTPATERYLAIEEVKK